MKRQTATTRRADPTPAVSSRDSTAATSSTGPVTATRPPHSTAVPAGC